MGVGFAFALLCLGAVREILGSGSLFGVQLFHDGFQDWVVMILPSGGFFTLAAGCCSSIGSSNDSARRADRPRAGGDRMTNESLWTIFLNACLVNNFVLAYFLGICPFLGVSAKLATATRMGGAVMFVMLVSSICAFGINRC